MDRCGECKSFTGAGDWNLCCMTSHPTPEEKKQGRTFPFGHLCYETTPACDMFDRKEDTNVSDHRHEE